MEDKDEQTEQTDKEIVWEKLSTPAVPPCPWTTPYDPLSLQEDFYFG